MVQEKGKLCLEVFKDMKDLEMKYYEDLGSMLIKPKASPSEQYADKILGIELTKAVFFMRNLFVEDCELISYCNTFKIDVLDLQQWTKNFPSYKGKFKFGFYSYSYPEDDFPGQEWIKTKQFKAGIALEWVSGNETNDLVKGVSTLSESLLHERKGKDSEGLTQALKGIVACVKASVNSNRVAEILIRVK